MLLSDSKAHLHGYYNAVFNSISVFQCLFSCDKSPSDMFDGRLRNRKATDVRVNVKRFVKGSNRKCGR